MNKKIKVPSFLHELHGENPTVFDLILTYSIAILVTSFIYFLSFNTDLTLLKIVVLLILSLDLAGGVVSNFSKSTTDYYKANKNLRYVFIPLHIIQPSILIWIFPQYWIPILIISIYVLLSMIFVNKISSYEKQRTIAPFLFSIALMLIVVFSINSIIVNLMLLLYAIKLIMAFAVRWE